MVSNKTKESNMDKTNELWGHITGRIDQIKALPDDIIINITDDDREHGRISKDSINYNDERVWVKLNHNTTLTLFVKSDYAVAKNKTRLNSVRLAQSEIAHTFDFSRAVELELIFKDWQETI